MVTRELAAQNPDQVRGLVWAINEGLKAAIADPDAAVAAVKRREPNLDVKANRQRLTGTLGLEMSHPDGGRHGIGDVDDDRLEGVAEIIAAGKKLPRVPAPAEVFDRGFLPPLAERVTSLAKG